MALIHRAELRPSKLELIRHWLLGRAEAAGAGEWEQVGTYRFDDPAGEVGIQTYLLSRRPDEPLLQVPLTYRGRPLPGAAHALIGELDHSVLGHRWIYDAAWDPVFVSQLVTCAVTGGTGVEEFVAQPDGEPLLVPPSVTVVGSGHRDRGLAVERLTVHDLGDRTTITTTGIEVTIARVLGGPLPDGDSVTATWPGGSAQLASVRRI